MKKLLFVLNPKSGRAQIKTQLLSILDIFYKEGYESRVHITQKSKDATEIVKMYGEEADLIVCSGGDGTLNETISGLMCFEYPPMLGYIPAGSTNDFASSLHISRNMLQAAKETVTGVPYSIDIGSFCGERYFVYIAAFGAFTEVSYMTPQEKKNLLGHQAYMIEGVKSLLNLKSYRLRIECFCEDEFVNPPHLCHMEEPEKSSQLRVADVLEGEFIFGMVTNTISVGGFKGLVRQDVSLNDGEFEVLLIRTPKTPAELSSILGCMMLKEEQNDYVYKFKTRSLHITSEEPIDWVLDGEFGGNYTEVDIKNLQNRMKIMRSL